MMGWGAVALTELFFLSLYLLLPNHSQSLAAQVLWVLVALLAGALAFVLINQWMLGAWADSSRVEEAENKGKLACAQKQLVTVLEINRQLATAGNEKTLMVSLLKVIGDYLGAAGATYIPLDEWGQPLATVSVGSVPEAELESWLERFDSPQTRERCRVCQALQAATGGGCPLGEHPFSNCQGITCFQLKRGDRFLGVLNFYRPSPNALEEDVRGFLSGILGQMAIAIEAIRIQQQELATLRQLQLARDPKMELSARLNGLLREFQRALEADYAYLALQSLEKTTLIESRPTGEVKIDRAAVENLIEQTMQSNLPQIRTFSLFLGEGNPVELTFLGAPIFNRESRPLGALLVGGTQIDGQNPLQLRLVETMVSQIVLLIEDDRHIQEMEYRAVMEERSRLAREIHDGLAQTLAFLKMQVAQMQNYLAREDLPRLGEVLRTNYRTLSDAYLDARQAIDYLRVTAEEGLLRWLDQTATDLQSSSDLDVSLEIKMDRIELSSEVQAQLIRVVQEALSNIRKHARATRVVISLREWQNDLILEISDNGQGYAPEDIPEGSQYGLRGMRERAELIGADFQVVSQPNLGTTVRLRLPYPYEETPV